MVQKQVQGKRPKLFRVTKKRSMALSQLLGSLRSHAEHKDDFLQDRLLHPSPKWTAEENAERIEKLKEEVARYKEAHDVITVVQNHHQAYLLYHFFMEERNWEHEWDVPLFVFERGIETAIGFLEHFKSRTNNPASYYDKPIQVLQEILAFRKADTSEMKNKEEVI